MKKYLMLAPILLFVLILGNCNKNEDSKSTMIEDRIAALETAINSRSYTGYMACFDDSASYQASYIESKFLSDYPATNKYTFSSDISIDGDTATVTSTKSTVASTTFNNVFEMIETDGDWYIKSWTEDGTIIFNKK